MKFLRGALAFFLCLLLLSFASRDKVEPTAANPEFDQAPLADRDFVFYTVQPGDTLQAITRRFRVMSEDQILALNPHVDASKLPVNERIKIPLE